MTSEIIRTQWPKTSTLFTHIIDQFNTSMARTKVKKISPGPNHTASFSYTVNAPVMYFSTILLVVDIDKKVETEEMKLTNSDSKLSPE